MKGLLKALGMGVLIALAGGFFSFIVSECILTGFSREVSTTYAWGTFLSFLLVVLHRKK